MLFGLTFTAVKYFAFGLVLGLLTAPRRGAESRRIVKEQGLAAVKGAFPTTGGQRTGEARSSV